MTQATRDLSAGLLLAALGCALLAAIPSQVGMGDGGWFSPAFMPAVIGIVIVALALLLAVQGWLRRHQEVVARVEGRGRAWLAICAVVAIIAGQAALMTYAGYIATGAVAVVLLALTYGHRRWWHLVLLAVVVPPALQLFFRYTMLVLLPQGSWLG
ncbi:MAG: tripartite tricarboxylate transporter TctB family protein [Alphaproteobacteria bacterium]